MDFILAASRKKSTHREIGNNYFKGIMALALPSFDKYVCIIRAQHALANQLLSNSDGFAVGDAEVAEVVQETGLPGLHVLPDQTWQVKKKHPV